MRLHEFGPAENLQFEQLPVPTPADGQVRIAVQAIGVRFIETTLRRGESVGPHDPPTLLMIPARQNDSPKAPVRVTHDLCAVTDEVR